MPSLYVIKRQSCGTDHVPFKYSIERLNCAFASRCDAVLVSTCRSSSSTAPDADRPQPSSRAAVTVLLTALGRQLLVVSDSPGFVSTRSANTPAGAGNHPCRTWAS